MMPKLINGAEWAHDLREWVRMAVVTVALDHTNLNVKGHFE
jgi:hypothetical protein